MAIIFRCPECDHKLRASTSAAGKKTKCKCGAAVVVPAADSDAEPHEDESKRGAWRLQPRFNAASGDLCEAITAWSPLCAPRSSRSAGQPPPASHRHTLLVGSVAIAALALVVVVVVLAFRQGNPGDPPAEQQQAHGNNNPPPPPQGDGQNQPLTPPGNNSTKKPGKKENTRPAGKDEANQGKTIEQPAQDGPSRKVETKQPSDGPKPKQDEPKSPPVEPKPKPTVSDRVEIVEWQTHAKVLTVDDKEPILSLGQKGEQAGFVLVSVKVRMPARVLANKKFVVEGPDIALSFPSVADPFAAIGCAVDDKTWFTTFPGQRAYSTPVDGVVVENWLFIASLKDLESGRTALQIKDQPAVLLTLSARRPQAK